ncbi:hypothetical protein [Halovivax asiaticus]|uniref:hypothetical protein n=1 Tax=Halovivax asiaticus TaxID=332953 RepID=UPI000677D295|nr:hypothetical protein [Halovivax asiaticus]
MNRRRVLLSVATVGSLSLSGCLEQFTTSDDDDSPTSDTSPSDDHPALSVLESYYEAAQSDDPDAIREYLHSAHPYNRVESDESGFTYEPAPEADAEHEIVDESFDPEAMSDRPSVAFWFEGEDTSFEAAIEGESAVLASSTVDTTEDGLPVERTEEIVLLTEDGEWAVFFPYGQSMEIDAEPVDDEAYDIVTDVTFDDESEQATVSLDGAGEVAADELRVYAESVGDYSRYWQQDGDTLPPVTEATTSFDPDGDEIVVTLLLEADEQVVIHREQYDPEN